jgi:translation initiation factor IF-3
VTWKEIRVSPKIDDHDIETKIKSASKFLAEGDKLKVTVRFRGRELAHPDRGRVLLMQIAERLKEHGTVERNPLLEGRSMSMIMNPVRGIGAAPAAPQPAAAAPAAPAAPRPAAPAPGTRPAPGLPRTPPAAPPSAAPAPRAAAPAPRPAAAPAPAPRPAAPRPAPPARPPSRSN